MNIDYLKIPEISVSYKDRVKTSNRFEVESSKDAVKVLGRAFQECMQHHEEAHVIFLNNSNRVLGVSCISKNGTALTIVDVKIVMQTALKVHAASIILSHNHPSGSVKPSKSDIACTKKLQNACELLEINFIDHIIMSAESYFSFGDENLL